MIADILLEELGYKNSELVDRCQVDILGHISTVKNEKRMGFS